MNTTLTQKPDICYLKITFEERGRFLWRYSEYFFSPNRNLYNDWSTNISKAPRDRQAECTESATESEAYTQALDCEQISYGSTTVIS